MENHAYNILHRGLQEYNRDFTLSSTKFARVRIRVASQYFTILKSTVLMILHHGEIFVHMGNFAMQQYGMRVTRPRLGGIGSTFAAGEADATVGHGGFLVFAPPRSHRSFSMTRCAGC